MTTFCSTRFDDRTIAVNVRLDEPPMICSTSVTAQPGWREASAASVRGASAAGSSETAGKRAQPANPSSEAVLSRITARSCVASSARSSSASSAGSANPSGCGQSEPSKT